MVFGRIQKAYVTGVKLQSFESSKSHTRKEREGKRHNFDGWLAGWLVGWPCSALTQTHTSTYLRARLIMHYIIDTYAKFSFIIIIIIVIIIESMDNDNWSGFFVFVFVYLFVCSCVCVRTYVCVVDSGFFGIFAAFLRRQKYILFATRRGAQNSRFPHMQQQ